MREATLARSVEPDRKLQINRAAFNEATSSAFWDDGRFERRLHNFDRYLWSKDLSGNGAYMTRLSAGFGADRLFRDRKLYRSPRRIAADRGVFRTFARAQTRGNGTARRHSLRSTVTDIIADRSMKVRLNLWSVILSFFFFCRLIRFLFIRDIASHPRDPDKGSNVNHRVYMSSI